VCMIERVTTSGYLQYRFFGVLYSRKAQVTAAASKKMNGEKAVVKKASTGITRDVLVSYTPLIHCHT